MDEEYKSLIDLYSYGHDIESSWLIERGARLLRDDDLSDTVSLISSALAKHEYHTLDMNISG